MANKKPNLDKGAPEDASCLDGYDPIDDIINASMDAEEKAATANADADDITADIVKGILGGVI